MKIATTKERILQYIDYKCISKQTFFKETGLKRGFLDADKLHTSIPDTFIATIIATYPEVNLEWLITGHEPMLKRETKQMEAIIPEIQILHHPITAEKKIQQQSIPLYNIEAAANLKTIFDNKEQNILGEISIPNIPRCDGAVYVRGDSMYPLLKSGDIIGYKEIYDFENVIFGEMYMVAYDIEGDEFVTVKYVNHSEREGYIKLVSYNTHHDPRDIQLQRISAMALVKFSIRMNTML